MAPSTALVFYLADPKTNEPRYIAAADDVLAERKRLVRAVRALPRSPLLVTLPRAKATADEQLALWHRIYESCDLLSSPPRDAAAPAELVTKYSEWVNAEQGWYAPLKPASERRTRHRVKPKPEPEPPNPTPEPEPKETKPKPKRTPGPKPSRVSLKDSLVRCNECGFLGKYASYKTHQKRTGHTNVTAIPRDKADAATLAELKRQTHERHVAGAKSVRHRCNDCGLVSAAAGMTKHQRSKGHTGRTRVKA